MQDAECYLLAKRNRCFNFSILFFFFSSNFEDYRDPLKIYDKGNATRSLKKLILKKKKRTKKIKKRENDGLTPFSNLVYVEKRMYRCIFKEYI